MLTLTFPILAWICFISGLIFIGIYIGHVQSLYFGKLEQNEKINADIENNGIFG